MKICTSCSQQKPVTEFHKRKDGYHPTCKSCRNASNRKWNAISVYKRVRNPEPTRPYPERSETPIPQSVFRKRVRTATPCWVKTLYAKQMKNVYDLRDEVSLFNGEPYHVDHIIPLSHPNVCGLNVPWNLQVLPAKINLQKSNKWL